MKLTFNHLGSLSPQSAYFSDNFFFSFVCIHLSCKRTFPTWNILAYNAIGGSGDELYGTEPMSYYIRNLTLNMGIAWPLSVAAPLLLAREYLHSNGNSDCKTMEKITLISPAIIWLVILFLRPHKVCKTWLLKPNQL